LCGARILRVICGRAARATRSGVLSIERSFVGLRPAILNKLDEKRSEGDQEYDVNQPAFMQYEFHYRPDDDQN
jgi:hypothetical protein